MSAAGRGGQRPRQKSLPRMVELRGNAIMGRDAMWWNRLRTRHRRALAAAGACGRADRRRADARQAERAGRTCRASPARSRMPASRPMRRRCAGPPGASTTAPTRIACAKSMRRSPAEAEGRDRIRGCRAQPRRERRAWLWRHATGPQRRDCARARPPAGILEPSRRQSPQVLRPPASSSPPAVATSRIPLHRTSTATSPSRSLRRRTRI